jgi:hypothetical protein
VMGSMGGVHQLVSFGFQLEDLLSVLLHLGLEL